MVLLQRKTILSKDRGGPTFLGGGGGGVQGLSVNFYRIPCTCLFTSRNIVTSPLPL